MRIIPQFAYRIADDETGRVTSTLAISVEFLTYGFGINANVITYPVGSWNSEHCDLNKPSVASIFCWNASWLMQSAKRGGEFLCQNRLFRWRGSTIFEGHKNLHEVTKVEEGTRVAVFLQTSLAKAVHPSERQVE